MSTSALVIRLPWGAKPKARPRVTRKGTFMPKDYTQWKSNVVEYLDLMASTSNSHFDGPVEINCTFYEEGALVSISAVEEEYQRAKHVRGDIDNLVGGIMDALQESTLIDNDSQVVRITAKVVNRHE